MPRFAGFHLGLHCLPKYPFGISSIQRLNALWLGRDFPKLHTKGEKIESVLQGLLVSYL